MRFRGLIWIEAFDLKCLWPIYWLIYLLYYINAFVLYFFNWIYTSLSKLLKRIWFEQNVFQNIICENFQIFRHFGSLFALVSSHFSVTKKLWRRFRLTRDSRQQVISKQAEISRRLVNLGKCQKDALYRQDSNTHSFLKFENTMQGENSSQIGARCDSNSARRGNTAK